MSVRARPAPPLLPRRTRTSVWLVLAGVLAGMAAAILVMIAGALAQMRPILDQRLAGAMTVVVSGRMDSGALESSDAAAARAREILGGLPGVAGVRVLEPASIDASLARILMAPPSSQDTGAPRVLAVSVAGGGSPATAPAERALSAEGLLFAIDDHGLWSGPCERLQILAAAAIGFGLLASIGILGALGGGAAGRRIDGVWPRLDILAQLGAAPERLARAVTWPMAARAAAAGAVGAILGIGVGRLGWPASAPLAPPLAPVAAAAALWLLLAAMAAQASAGRVAARRLLPLFA